MKITVKNLILGLIIAVIFVMFCAYGTKLVYEEPEYSDFCKIKPAQIGEENRNISFEKQGECRGWEEAREKYAKNLFVISIVFGLIAIVVSALFISVSSVSGGLMLGSLFFIVYGTGHYWEYMNDLLRFGILGVALIILIFLGYKINEKIN